MATIPLSGRVGIYAIVNLVNGKRYVGSSVDIQGRFGSHRRALLAGSHHSGHLQAAWNKYGRDSFDFVPLLLCARDTLLDYEQRCIDGLRPEYNICRDAMSRLGVKNTPEHNEKIRAGNKGQKRSAEHVAAMSARARLQAAMGRTKPPPPMKPEVKARVDAEKRGRKQPAAAVERRARLAAEKMRDPAFKAAAVAALRSNEPARRQRAAEASRTDRARAACSERMSAAWADASFREKVVARSLASHDEAWSRRQKEGAACKAMDPDFQARRLAAWRSPDVQERMRQSQSSPECKAKRAAAAREQRAKQEEVRQRAIARMREINYLGVAPDRRSSVATWLEFESSLCAVRKET